MSRLNVSGIITGLLTSIDHLRPHTQTALEIEEEELRIEKKQLALEKEELKDLRKLEEDLIKFHAIPVLTNVLASPIRYLLVKIGTTQIHSQGNLHMTFELKDNPQESTLTVTLTDVHGFPASPVSATVWANSNPGVLDLVAATDGKTAHVTSVAPGTATVTATTDGIVATFDATVLGGAVATAVITASAPTDVVLAAPAPVEPAPVADLPVPPVTA